MARTNLPWTPARLQKLRHLWVERKLTPGQIAQILSGTTRHAVRWQLIMMGLIPSAPRKGRRPPGCKGILITDLQPHHCRFPLWSDTEKPTGMFCGKPKKPGSSYCDEHHVRVHTSFRKHSISKPLEDRIVYVRKR